MKTLIVAVYVLLAAVLLTTFLAEIGPFLLRKTPSFITLLAIGNALGCMLMLIAIGPVWVVSLATNAKRYVDRIFQRAFVGSSAFALLLALTPAVPWVTPAWLGLLTILFLMLRLAAMLPRSVLS